MNRIDQLREARTSPHVSFTEYLKLRSRCSGVVLIFEGKQCPSVYIGWLRQFLKGACEGQIIARGKRNVMALREIIKRNAGTYSDKNIYFVDRDYDIEPKQGSFNDVYVTRGYSIENEMINWVTLELYIRSYFDIADSEDQDAVATASEVFRDAFDSYLHSTFEVQHVIYICRTKGIRCLPGETAFNYVSVDFERRVSQKTYGTLDELLDTLKVDVIEQGAVKKQLVVKDDFGEINPAMDWRGKFHLSFIKKFLTLLRDTRVAGKYPFKRGAKVDTDPGHPSILGMLGACTPAPPCLIDFLKKFSATTVLAI